MYLDFSTIMENSPKSTQKWQKSTIICCWETARLDFDSIFLFKTKQIFVVKHSQNLSRTQNSLKFSEKWTNHKNLKSFARQILWPNIVKWSSSLVFTFIITWCSRICIRKQVDERSENLQRSPENQRRHQKIKGLNSSSLSSFFSSRFNPQFFSHFQIFASKNFRTLLTFDQ